MRISSFFLALLLTGGALWAQHSYSLQDCMSEAFKNSNLLKIADTSVAMSRDNLIQAQRQRIPNFTAKGTYLRIAKVASFSIPTGPGGQMQEFKFGTPNRINGEVGFGLPLFTFGRIQSQIDMAATGIELSGLDRQQKALDLTDIVLRSYFAVLISQKAIDTNRINMQRAQKNLQTAETRYNKGLVPKLEFLRAQVQATNTQTMLDDTQSALEKSNIMLAKTIGHEGENLTAQGELMYIPIQVHPDSLIKRAYAQRYDLAALSLQKTLLNSQIDMTKTAQRPTLMGIGGYTVQNGFSPMNPDEFIDNWNAGVQLSFPFYDGGITRQKIQQVQKQITSAQLQEKEIREMIAMQIRQSVVSLKQAEQKYRVQKDNIEFAQQALQSAEAQYSNGLASSLDLIAAQQALSESELMYLRALFSHVMAKLDLCKAIGDYSFFEETLDF
jgi:outer membrane protein